jgi:hypothetical protein
MPKLPLRGSGAAWVAPSAETRGADMTGFFVFFAQAITLNTVCLIVSKFVVHMSWKNSFILAVYVITIMTGAYFMWSPLHHGWYLILLGLYSALVLLGTSAVSTWIRKH